VKDKKQPQVTVILYPFKQIDIVKAFFEGDNTFGVSQVGLPWNSKLLLERRSDGRYRLERK
jgi:hypothetical protein